MSVKGVLSSVESLVKKIEENKDLILNQLKGKECYSSSQMSLNDHKIVSKLLSCYEPKEAKRLGRLVQNFDPNLWVRIGNEMNERE
jgi:predicted NAD-dependent protein-ADP-ribosyltransferase YbiA (DUF1768 family)